MTFRRVVALAVLLFLVALPAWPGRKFPAAPEDVLVPREYLFRLRPGRNAVTVLQRVSPLLAALSAVFRLNGGRDVYRVVLPPIIGDLLVDQLAADSDVDYLEPNRIRQLAVAAPNDSKYSTQWALTNIHAYDAWRVIPNQYPTGGDGSGRLKVAVLDTGADCTHPDFRNAGALSVYSPGGGQFSLLSDALVPTTVNSPACTWQDDHGHGTHTAGTIAAATGNGQGVSSLGYGVQLLVYKVTDVAGNATDSTLAAAIMEAADAGARVISMSLGGAGYSQTMQDAINYAWSKDTVVVAAAGNNNSNTLFFPAGAAHAVGVAATDTANNRALFSNYGSGVDIAAPGVGILSTLPTYSTSGVNATNYGGLSGTSMSTPHVAALAGLVAMANPGLAAQGISRRIQVSAESSAADGGWGQYLGYGVINAARAVSGGSRPATTGSIVGQLLDTTGTPVGGTVTVGGTVLAVSTTGLFRLSGLAGGSYTLAVLGAAGSQTQEVAVVPGADTTTTVVVGANLGAITGTVSAAGAGLPGAVVQALNAGAVVQEALSDPTGHYSLPLQDGTYDLRISAAGFAVAVKPGYSVAGGSGQSVDVSLSALGRVTGTVKNSGGQPLANADILIQGSGSSTGAMTDAAGVYTSIGLPADAYTVTASVVGQSPLSQPGVQVANDQVVTQDFGFTSVGVSVTPAGVTLTQSQTQQFSANVTGLIDPRVTWTRAPTIGAISSTGLYTAPGAISKPYDVTITATSVTAPTVSGTTVVTVANVFSVALTSSNFTGGLTTKTNKILLDTAAGDGGAVVALSTSDPSLLLPPATVTVAAGATISPTFNLVSSFVSANQVVSLYLTYGGVTKTVNITIRPAALSSISLSPPSVGGGGTTSSNRINLDGPAGTGGVTVSLSSSSPDIASVPASVSVAEGSSSSAYFPITTKTVAAVTPVTITATYLGVSKTATLTLSPVTLSSLTTSPASVVGGVSATANRVTLNGPAPAGGILVPITSSVPAVAVPPASVLVPEGATYATLTITTVSVSVSTPVQISATLFGKTVSGTLTVRPAALSSLILSPKSVSGGASATGSRIYLDGPAGSSGATVALSSSNPAVATVPASVTIPSSSSSSGAITITTTAVAATTAVTITATYLGVSRTATLTVNAMGLASLTVSPASLVGGVSATANRVTLSGPAPAGGISVPIVSSLPAVATPPASVLVPAGATYVTFTVTTTAVAVSTPVTISATQFGTTVSGTLTVRPAALVSLTLNPSSMGGGASGTANRVFLDGPAGPGGATVALSSSSPAAIPPASVTVLAGASSSNAFTINSNPVAVSTTATISATYLGVTKTANLTIKPTTLSVLTISPAALVGGATGTGNRVALDSPAPAGGAVVLISSSNPAVAAVPASVTVAEGTATSPNFSIVTTAVAAATPVTISASYGGVTKPATLTVNPMVLTSLVVSPVSVVGPVSARYNRVTLNGPAPPAGITVGLSSSNPAVASVPASAVVPAGATTSPNFTISTVSVTVSTVVTISATYGSVTKTASLTVRPVALSSFLASPATLKGGSNISSRLYFDGPAPAGGIAVALSASDPTVVTVPATIPVAAGATSSAGFAIPTKAVAATTTVVVTATYNGTTKTVTLTLTP